MLMLVVETGQALLMAFLSLNYFTKFEKFLSKNETRLPLWIHARRYRAKISSFGRILDIHYAYILSKFLCEVTMCFFIYKMDYKILLVQLTSGNGHHRKFLQDERFYLGYILHTFDQNPYVLVAVYTVLILLINNVY